MGDDGSIQSLLRHLVPLSNAVSTICGAVVVVARVQAVIYARNWDGPLGQITG